MSTENKTIVSGYRTRGSFSLIILQLDIFSMKIQQKVQAVVVDKESNKILLLRRYDFYYKKKPFWRLVKGGVEKGENKIQALEREIKEETGLKNIKISRKVHNYFYFDPRNIKMNVHCYKVLVDRNEKMTLDKNEGIVGFKWVTPKLAVRLLKYKEEKDVVKKLINMSLI